MTAFLLMLSAADPRFTVEAATGRPPEAVIDRLDADRLTFLDGTLWPTADLLELRAVGRALPPPPLDRPHLRLTDGDVWPGEFLDLENEQVRFRAEFGEPVLVRLPLERIAAIELIGRSSPSGPSPTGDDRVTLINGDVLTGSLTAFAENGPLLLEQNGRPRPIERRSVRTIEPAADLARAPARSGIEAVFADGSRVKLQTVTIEAGVLTGRAVAGPRLVRPISELIRLRWRDGRTIPLSELEPRSFTAAPTFGDRLVSLTRTPDGLESSIRWPGWGRAVYAIPAGSTRWQAAVSIDGPESVRATVRLRVRVDGQTSKDGERRVTTDQPPGEWRIDLPAGAREFEMESDPITVIGGVVVWGEARFVRPDRPTPARKTIRKRNP